MRYPGFIDTWNRSQSPIANGEVTVNWYLEGLPPASKNALALYPTPGQRAFATAPKVGTRALVSMNDRTLAVVADTLYDLLGNQTVTSRGALAVDANPATINLNGMVGNEAFVTSGNNGYLLDLGTNVWTQVLTGKALMGGSLDGYFLAFDRLTNRFYISDLDDGLTWDPTQFAQRQDAPDNWTAMLVNAPDIWMLGEQTGSVWFDAGAFPFPFAPRPGATFKYGTRAPWSLASAGGAVLWLSHNADGAGIVVRANGYDPQPISTPAVETAIAGYARAGSIDNAEALCYQQAGHTFYVLKFTQATWVYDLTTDRWHQRGHWIPSEMRFVPWRPRVHAHAYGQNLVGEAESGQISTLDLLVGTEADGAAIRRVRVAPSIFSENRPLEHRRLEFFLEMGLGTPTGQGADPKLMARASDDGGQTWGNEQQLSVGKIGEYRRRAYLTRLGIPRDRVYELTVTDPIPWRLIDAFLNNDAEAA